MYKILFLFAAGYIRTDWPRIQFFTPGETITLRVNISTAGIYGIIFTFDITRLAWFHNGTEVAANCTSGRFTVNARGTELNITNTTSSDGGLYTVRVSSTTYMNAKRQRIGLRLHGLNGSPRASRNTPTARQGRRGEARRPDRRPGPRRARAESAGPMRRRWESAGGR